MLYAPSGEKLSETSGSESLSFQLEKAELWNAERPAQYTVVLSANGESIRQMIGIRQIEIRDAVIYLNNKKIKFKGVNRHDSDPVTGFAISREQLITDLRRMKEHNVNAIRTKMCIRDSIESSQAPAQIIKTMETQNIGILNSWPMLSPSPSSVRRSIGHVAKLYIL